MRRHWFSRLFLLILPLLPFTFADAGQSKKDHFLKVNYLPGEILVKLKDNVSFEQVAGQPDFAFLTKKKKFQFLSDIKGREYLLLKTRTGSSLPVHKLLNLIKDHPAVENACPNYMKKLARIPNDPLFRKQWALKNRGETVFLNTASAGADINAQQAWDTNTGSPEVVVAVVDSGIDLNHPDLKQNIWKNSSEIPGNSIDDDGNGYTDDYYGFDFAADFSGSNRAEPVDSDGHGSHVSGIIAAQGNNQTGVSGICWTAKIMPLKVMRPDGNIYLSDVVEAIEYAAKMKSLYQVNIVAINASYGSENETEIERDAIDEAGRAGIIVCAAVGNGDDDGNPINIDDAPFYPASFELDNIISIAASNEKDDLASFSNYGENSVDLAAPGTGILSTVITGRGREASISTNNRSIAALSLEYSGSTAGIEGLLIYCNRGVLAEDFPPSVSGNIALIERGDVLFRDKVSEAMKAGAAAAVIYNNEPGNFSGTLSAWNNGNWIPALSISQLDGQYLKNLGEVNSRVVNRISDYDFYEGTSMAAPHVSGAIALNAARHGNEIYAVRIARILISTEPVFFSMFGKVKTGGRLNISYHGIQQPLDLRGKTVDNQSLFQTEEINVLEWQANPQNASKQISGYKIYRLIENVFTLAGEVDAATFEFSDRGRQGRDGSVYAVAAFNSSGQSGEPSFFKTDLF